MKHLAQAVAVPHGMEGAVPNDKTEEGISLYLEFAAHARFITEELPWFTAFRHAFRQDVRMNKNTVSSCI